jgi:hypothetical protein
MGPKRAWSCAGWRSEVWFRAGRFGPVAVRIAVKRARQQEDPFLPTALASCPLDLTRACQTVSARTQFPPAGYRHE